MALSVFTKDVTKQVFRQGNAFVTDDSGTTYYDLGSIKDGVVQGTPVLSAPNSGGQQVVLGYDFECTFMMQQTDDTEIAAITDLLNDDTLWLKMTTVPTNAAGAAAAAGYVFKNVLIGVNVSLNFMGDESNFEIKIGGRVSIAEFIKLGSSQEITLTC